VSIGERGCKRGGRDGAGWSWHGIDRWLLWRAAVGREGQQENESISATGLRGVPTFSGQPNGQDL